MEKIDRPILVPWDFSQVAENAFRHAIIFSNALKREIVLLHIIPDDKNRQEKEKELDECIERLATEYGKKPSYEIMSGNIFKTIGNTAKENRAEMIIMGTHGMKGAQKLFGSKALKVVVSSRIPFLVVQGEPLKTELTKILLPIDFRSENKEKISWIYYLARNFHSSFIILKPTVKDKGFKRKIRSNLKYIESFLKGHDIEYKIVTATGNEAFKFEVANFAKEHEVDMILVMTTRGINFFHYTFGAPEQFIIANKHAIPVMCVNPKPRKLSGGFRASGG